MIIRPKIPINLEEYSRSPYRIEGLKYARLLYKPKYLKSVLNSIADTILDFSISSVEAIFTIYDSISTKYNEINLDELLRGINYSLSSGEPLRLHLPKTFEYSDVFFRLIEGENYQLFVTRFFDYYYSRLIVLLKISIYHKGKRLRPSKIEVDLFRRSCLCKWRETFPELANSYEFTNDEWKFLLLTRFFISSKKRDDMVYDSEWLFKFLEEYYPMLVYGGNYGKLTGIVIDGQFSIFFDSLQRYYNYLVYYWANFGWFVGDLDSNERIEILKKRNEN